MNKTILFSTLFILFTSCHHSQKVIGKPFDVNHKIRCEDLVDQGYRWMPETDAILFDKISGDTLDYYDLDYDIEYDETELPEVENDITDLETEEAGTNNSVNSRELERKTDSIFKGVYFEPLDNKAMICRGAAPTWRYFKVLIAPKDTADINRFISQKYMDVIEIEDDLDYYIYKSKVINRITNDTFNCQIVKENGRYFLSTSVYLKR